MKKMIKILISWFGCALLIGLDRWTKIWADLHVAGKGVISVVGNMVILVYAKNRGAFLSMGNSLGHTLWYICFVILPIIFIIIATIYVFRKYSNDNSVLVLWVLFFSGGAGNVIDRVLYGRVTDFMNIGIGEVVRSGIFNVADLYIVAAIGIVAVNALKPKNTTP